MQRDPILARKDIRGYDNRGRERVLPFYVKGGLHYINRNSSPHFSLTYDHGGSCGAGHETILEHFPQFADMAAMHLSDIDGVPMYALENGFYHLGGTHWERPKFDVAARHFRITEDEARALVANLFGDSFSVHAGFLSKGEAAKAKSKLALWVEQQKPRWKAEAEACIANHKLVVYGDPWPVAA